MAVDPNDPRFWQAWNNPAQAVGQGDQPPPVEPPLVPGFEGYGQYGPIEQGNYDHGWFKYQGTPYYASQPYYNEYGQQVPPPDYRNDAMPGPTASWEDEMPNGPYGHGADRSKTSDLYVTPYDAPVSMPYAPPAWPYGNEDALSAAHGPQPDGTGDWEQAGPDEVPGHSDMDAFGGAAHWWDNYQPAPVRRLPRPPTGIPWLDQLQPGEQVDW